MLFLPVIYLSAPRDSFSAHRFAKSLNALFVPGAEFVNPLSRKWVIPQPDAERPFSDSQLFFDLVITETLFAQLEGRCPFF